MRNLKIAVACDHAGYETKEFLKKFLLEKGYEIKDFGTYSDKSVDYPDFAHPMAAVVNSGEFPLGLSLCGSGNGINITVNKHQAIRSALCWNPEIAELARLHNNANICAIPARFVSKEEAKEILAIFLKTDFDGGRHLTRINKIPLG